MDFLNITGSTIRVSQKIPYVRYRKDIRTGKNFVMPAGLDLVPEEYLLIGIGGYSGVGGHTFENYNKKSLGVSFQRTIGVCGCIVVVRKCWFIISYWRNFSFQTPATICLCLRIIAMLGYTNTIGLV